MAKRPIKGLVSLRRTLRNLPESARQELADSLDLAGMHLRNQAQAQAPRKTGALVANIGYRVQRKSLRLRVGFVTKKAARQAFYAWILEWGRKARTVTARRAGGQPYQYRVSPIAKGAYTITSNLGRLFRLTELPRFGATLELILHKAAKGAGND